VLILLSMIVLVYCAELHSSATYQDVVLACCGLASQCCSRAAHWLCSLTVALYSFGTCITFLIIIGDQWDKCKSAV